MPTRTYKTAAEERADKAELERLRTALNGAKTSVRRNGDSLWTIRGRDENYISTWGDGASWLIVLHCRSGQAWTWAKKRLACAEVSQDGDEEGCLRLWRLPSLDEATEIRNLVGIRQPGPVTSEGPQSRP